VTNVWKRKFPFKITHGDEISSVRQFVGTNVPPVELKSNYATYIYVKM